MKTLKRWLRVLIASSSIAGFLAGWAMLAHSGKPAQAAPMQPVPAIVAPAPLNLPGLSSGNGMGLQPLAPLPQQQLIPQFRLRTGGS